MTKLEKMIKELCQDGAEYKTIEEICENVFSGGTPKTSVTEYYDGDIPWLRSGEINFNVIKETEKFITEKGLVESSAKWIRKNSVLIALTGATVARSAVNEIPLTANQSVCAMETKEEIINYKYLYYCIENMYNNIKGMAQGALTSINLGIIKKLSVPVPPLEVQREIVRILDNFTELTAELTEKLTAELTACKKQYEYYRDTVIISNQNVPMVKLGGFAEIIRGGNFQKKDFADEGRPCIHYGQMYTYFGVHTDKTIKYVSEETFNKSKQAVPNDIVMAVTSENVEDVCSCTAWVGKEAIAVSGHTAIIHHNQNAKYLSYYFHTSHFFSQKKKLAHGIKVIEVTPSKLADILVPLPSLEEQARIVSILDRFNVIFDDIFTGLLAEIEARQKQYEYYREKLLTFKELNS